MCRQMVARHCFCSDKDCAADAHKDHSPHVPGYQWGYTTLERVRDVDCPPAAGSNPHADPDKCDNIIGGVLRIESRCPGCESFSLQHGVRRGSSEGRALGGDIPHEKAFAGSWEAWAGLVSKARQEWLDGLRKRKHEAQW